MVCLVCKQEVIQRPSWSSLLFLTETKACDECLNKLTRISGPSCPSCCRPQKTGELCKDCNQWELDSSWNKVLDKNYSLFEYNETMKKILSVFKFRGDAMLVHLFEEDMMTTYKDKLSTLHFDWAVPIPLSKERLYERGFNQAELLANFLPLPQLHALQRTHQEKQSKKSRIERLSAANVFSIIVPKKVINKRILLVDDLYTTGSTLRHAAKVLRDNGAKIVVSLTLIRS